MSKEIYIGKYVIDTPIIDILMDIKERYSNLTKLASVEERGDEIRVTCPNEYHSQGNEKHPSCGIYIGDDDKYGLFNCFTCHEKGSFIHFIALVFNKDDEFAANWLIKTYGEEAKERGISLLEIKLDTKSTPLNLDDSILDLYEDYHPYLKQRKLSKEICERFKVKYDPSDETVVFPVYDEHNNFLGVTKRSVKSKYFWIGVKDKPVYLLNEIIKNNIKAVAVCESQINALTCWEWGIPAIALFGTGTEDQYNILNRSGIRTYFLLFDGDNAGRKAAERFKNNIRQDTIVEEIVLPEGKDVNDLSKEEFYQLMEDYI